MHETSDRPLIWDQLGFSRFEILVCLIRQLMYKSTEILHEYVISNPRSPVDVDPEKTTRYKFKDILK